MTKQNNLTHVNNPPLTESPNGGSEIACRFLKAKCYSLLTNLSHKTKNFNNFRARLIINFTVRLQILLSNNQLHTQSQKFTPQNQKELHYFLPNQCKSHKSLKKVKKKKYRNDRDDNKVNYWVHRIPPIDPVGPFSTIPTITHHFSKNYIDGLLASHESLPNSPYFFFIHFLRPAVLRVPSFSRFPTDFIILPISTALRSTYSHGAGTRWNSWRRHYATSRKIPVSIPGGVTEISHRYSPSSRTTPWGPA